MRLQFLASEGRRPDQFTVLVRNVPPDPDEPVSELVEHFFRVNNHPDHYLTNKVVYDANKLSELVEEVKNWLDFYELKYARNQSRRPTRKIGFLGLWGKQVDAIDHYTSEVDSLSKEASPYPICHFNDLENVYYTLHALSCDQGDENNTLCMCMMLSIERDTIAVNPKAIMPAAFVSFKSRCGAAVCAQTQQTRNPTIWLTEWASEPRDLYWNNLAIPYVSLSVRRLIIDVAFFFLTFFFMIPIAFVQSLANLEGIEKAMPFLKPVIEL